MGIIAPLLDILNGAAMAFSGASAQTAIDLHAPALAMNLLVILADSRKLAAQLRTVGTISAVMALLQGPAAALESGRGDNTKVSLVKHALELLENLVGSASEHEGKLSLCFFRSCGSLFLLLSTGGNGVE